MVPAKPVLPEDEMERKSRAIIEEYLHLNDSKVQYSCVLKTHKHTHTHIRMHIHCV